MRVIRWEKNNFGVYASGYFLDLDTSITPDRPLPELENPDISKLPWWTDMRHGFVSQEQESKWFSPSEQVALKMKGADRVVYSVPGKWTVVTPTQVVFKASEARRVA